MSDIPILHWRRKLYALLHDSPDKASRIAGHEDLGWTRKSGH